MGDEEFLEHSLTKSLFSIKQEGWLLGKINFENLKGSWNTLIWVFFLESTAVPLNPFCLIKICKKIQSVEKVRFNEEFSTFLAKFAWNPWSSWGQNGSLFLACSSVFVEASPAKSKFRTIINFNGYKFLSPTLKNPKAKKKKKINKKAYFCSNLRSNRRVPVLFSKFGFWQPSSACFRMRSFALKKKTRFRKKTRNKSLLCNCEVWNCRSCVGSFGLWLFRKVYRAKKIVGSLKQLKLSVLTFRLRGSSSDSPLKSDLLILILSEVSVEAIGRGNEGNIFWGLFW